MATLPNYDFICDFPVELNGRLCRGPASTAEHWPTPAEKDHNHEVYYRNHARKNQKPMLCKPVQEYLVFNSTKTSHVRP